MNKKAVRSFDELAEDHSGSKVPKEELVSGYRVALVIIGFSITIPLMITGSNLGYSIGLDKSMPAFFIGGLILMLIGMCTAAVGAMSRVSTYMIVKIPFGVHGAKLINLVLASTLLGWYGVTAALFGEAVAQAVSDYWGVEMSKSLLTVIGSFLMVAVTIFGFKALDKLSLWLVPLMLIFLGVILFKALSIPVSVEQGVNSVAAVSMGEAISITVGGYIVGATLIPDLSRYTISIKQSILAVAVSLGVALPLVLLIPAVAGSAARERDLVEILVGLGLGLPAIVMIAFATWTSNVNNLYSSSLAVASIFSNTRKWVLTLIVGFICTLIAVSGLTDLFIPFLLLLGIAIPPIAGIYVADFFFLNKSKYYEGDFDDNSGVSWFAMFSWFAAALIGYLSANDLIALSTIPSCDSTLSSVVIYVLLKKYLFKISSYERQPV